MRIYATEDLSGRRVLLRIECDHAGCDEKIVPGPDIASSGWRKAGQDHGPGSDKLEWDYCPEHAS